MDGKVHSIARDCSTFHRWNVTAKPDQSKLVIKFIGLVEAILAEIVSPAATAVAGAKAWSIFTVDAQEETESTEISREGGW